MNFKLKTWIGSDMVDNQYRRGFQKWLAKNIGIAESLLSMTINEKRAVSIDLARKLHKKFPSKKVIFWFDIPLLTLESCLWDLGKDEYLKSLIEPKTEKEKES